MQVLHISAECYPMAKAGGLGDVVGALPKYLNQKGISTGVVIPKYNTPWMVNQVWTLYYSGQINLAGELTPYSIWVLNEPWEFPLYAVDIPGKFDREGIYLNNKGKGYADEVERSISFQRAVLQWICEEEKTPKLIHCHDHHTGLVPFMVKHCPEFEKLKEIPTVYTIHNAAYSGAFSWNKVNLLPLYDGRKGGLLDWDEQINPLAAAIKCCWKLTTVSPSYMIELREKTIDLRKLLQQEAPKSLGILNGIDAEVWDPATDELLPFNLKKSFNNYKKESKKAVAQLFNIDDIKRPIITFIGRLAREKGVDLLVPSIENFFYDEGVASFIILGTGDPYFHELLSNLKGRYPGIVDVVLEYNEKLAHTLYAGSDFIWMPSRVEPCGLNQMYAMRYGSIPIVRAVGGLKDTVIDIAQEDGRGIQFKDLFIESSTQALHRAVALYQEQKRFMEIRAANAELDFSWGNSAANYAHLYRHLLALSK